jgi:transcription-repair coupling factor (superfamily II helicase)
VAEISRLSKEGDAPRLQLKGLAGALESMLVAATYRNSGGHHLVIGADKEEAAYIQNSIAALLPKKQVRLLPDSFRRPLYFEVLDPTNVLLRTETINYLTHSKSKGEIVVTYPEALFEQVVAPAELTSSRIEMTRGETLDVDTIITVLAEYGFKRQDFVYEPGQFSIRGGIVDIFSYGNEYPYRIELFDDEIESIRTFDPLQQLSIDKVEYVSIVPNINTKFGRDQKTSIFEVLPEDSTIWMRDFQLLLDRLGECFRRAEDFAKNLTIIDDEELANIFRDRAFIRPGEVLADVEGKPIIFFSDYQQSMAIDHTIDCPRQAPAQLQQEL